MYLERNKNRSNNNKSIIKYYTHLNNLIIIQPRRRIGIWRKIPDEKGALKKCFISISGDTIFEPKCFNISKYELSLLQEYNISQRGFNSNIDNALLLEIYLNSKGIDKSHLNYWCVPKSIQYQYLSKYNFNKLNDWQINALSNILKFIVTDIDDYYIKNNLYKFEKNINIISSSLIISSNNKDNLLICEIISLYRLLFSGKNILIIFTDLYKCESYYERSKSLFGKDSLNLRIELFTNNTKSINTWLPNIDISICSLDKGNHLINKLLSDNMLENCIGTIIIDDINYIDNNSKSYILEGIIAKISYLNSIEKNNKYHSINCIYVSNDNNYNELKLNLYKKIMNINYLVFNDNNNIHVDNNNINFNDINGINDNNMHVDKGINNNDNNNNILYSDNIYIKKNNLLYCWKKSESNDNYNIIKLYDINNNNSNLNNSNNINNVNDLIYLSELILESLLFEKKLLVFFPTIDWCKKSQYSLLQLLKEKIKNINNNKFISIENNILIDKIRNFCIKNNDIKLKKSRILIINNLKKVSNNNIIDNEYQHLLFESIFNYGIAFHNGKLSFKEKKILEDSFNNNKIMVFFCTCLNIIDSELKVDRIIIRSIGMGKINQKLKNNSGNREWISKELLKEYLYRINKIDLSEEKNQTINKYYKKGIFIFVNNDLEFNYIDKLLNNNDINFNTINSQLKDIYLSKFILELIQTNIINNLSKLKIILKDYTLNHIIDNLNDGEIINNILLSLLFLIITNLLFIKDKLNNTNINELLLSNKYIESINELNYFKSPIICSKFALINFKNKQEFNKYILNIILKQNNYLINIESGKKYLYLYLNNKNILNDENLMDTTSLANALIYIQIHPCIALEIYSELFKLKFFGIDLSNELQIYMLSLQAYFGKIPKINWNYYIELFNRLNSNELYIADLYGININLISHMLKIVNSNPNLIPDLTNLSPINLHNSYFFLETLNYKGLIEKYRLINIYKFYYSCLLRDICNPVLTIDIIMNLYNIELSDIKEFINSFKISTITVSNLCKQLGLLELSDIIQYIINHMEFSISIRNVKYMCKLFKNNLNDCFNNEENKNILNNNIKIINFEFELDEQDIVKIINYINNVKNISSYITPNIAISLYFFGLNCIEKIATSKLETIIDSINCAKKLDNFGLLSYKYDNLIDTHIKAQEIIDNAKKIINKSKLSIDDESYSELDVDVDVNADIDLNLELELELELEQEENLDLLIDSNLLFN